MSSEENYFIFPEKAYKYTDDFICEEFICPTGLYFWTEGCAYCDAVSYTHLTLPTTPYV